MDSTFLRDDDHTFDQLGDSYSLAIKDAAATDATFNDRDKSLHSDQTKNGQTLSLTEKTHTEKAEKGSEALKSNFLTVEDTNADDEYGDEVASMHNITLPSKDLEELDPVPASKAGQARFFHYGA